VSQAAGRLLRHARDFGALFLLDARYRAPPTTGALAPWILPPGCLKPSQSQAQAQSMGKAGSTNVMLAGPDLGRRVGAFFAERRAVAAASAATPTSPCRSANSTPLTMGPAAALHNHFPRDPPRAMGRPAPAAQQPTLGAFLGATTARVPLAAAPSALLSQSLNRPLDRSPQRPTAKPHGHRLEPMQQQRQSPAPMPAPRFESFDDFLVAARSPEAALRNQQKAERYAKWKAELVWGDD